MRVKGDTKVQDVPKFKEVKCVYCGEKFRSQVQVKDYPNEENKLVVCRADCGRKGKHILNGNSPRKKYKEIKELSN